MKGRFDECEIESTTRIHAWLLSRPHGAEGADESGWWVRIYGISVCAQLTQHARTRLVTCSDPTTVQPSTQFDMPWGS